MRLTSKRWLFIAFTSLAVVVSTTACTHRFTYPSSVFLYAPAGGVDRVTEHVDVTCDDCKCDVGGDCIVNTGTPCTPMFRVILGNEYLPAPPPPFRIVPSEFGSPEPSFDVYYEPTTLDPPMSQATLSTKHLYACNPYSQRNVERTTPTTMTLIGIKRKRPLISLWQNNSLLLSRQSTPIANIEIRGTPTAPYFVTISHIEFYRLTTAGYFQVGQASVGAALVPTPIGRKICENCGATPDRASFDLISSRSLPGFTKLVIKGSIYTTGATSPLGTVSTEVEFRSP